MTEREITVHGLGNGLLIDSGAPPGEIRLIDSSIDLLAYFEGSRGGRLPFESRYSIGMRELERDRRLHPRVVLAPGMTCRFHRPDLIKKHPEEGHHHMTELTEAIRIEIDQEVQSFDAFVEGHNHRMGVLERMAKDAESLKSPLEQLVDGAPAEREPDEITVEPESDPDEAMFKTESETAPTDPNPPAAISSNGSTPVADNPAGQRDLEADALSFVGKAFPAGVSTADVAEDLNVTAVEARELLKELNISGKLTREGAGRYTRWSVAGSDGHASVSDLADTEDEPTDEQSNPGSTADHPISRDDWARLEGQVYNSLDASPKPMSPPQLATLLDVDPGDISVALNTLKAQERIHLVRSINGDKFEVAGKK